MCVVQVRSNKILHTLEWFWATYKWLKLNFVSPLIKQSYSCGPIILTFAVYSFILLLTNTRYNNHSFCKMLYTHLTKRKLYFVPYSTAKLNRIFVCKTFGNGLFPINSRYWGNKFLKNEPVDTKKNKNSKINSKNNNIYIYISVIWYWNTIFQLLLK